MIELAYFKLLKGGSIGGPPVDCHSSEYDLIDQQVLTAVLQFFDGYTDSSGHYHPPGNSPIAYSVDSPLQDIGQILNKSLSLIGIDLGTDQYLAVGLLLGDGTGAPIGTPMTFDPHVPPLFALHPPPGYTFAQDDWGLGIDTSLVTPFIIARASAAATAADPSVTVSNAAVNYTASGIVVDVSASKPIAPKIGIGSCGNVPFTAEAIITPAVCSCGSNLNANFRMCLGTPSVTPNFVSAAQAACVFGVSIDNAVADGLSALFKGVADSFRGGMAVATITTGPGPCPDNRCTNLGVLRLPLGNDTLYAVELDVNGVFYLAGRSQLLDATQPGRATLPASCP